MTTPTTAHTTPRDLASRLTAVAELVEDMAELGEVGNIHISLEQVMIQPETGDAIDRVRVVANWAQYCRVPVGVHVILNTSAQVLCTLTHRDMPITVFASLGVRDAWKLARLLQVDLDEDTATVDAGCLISAIAGGTE